jgi:hypothetical protein
MNRPQHLCFYSNNPKDQWSKAFIEELAKTPWTKEFQFICVDPAPNRPQLPGWLKQVPTLVIKGDENPVKTDTEVMNWLYERKLREMPKSQSATKVAMASAGIDTEQQSWNPNEMSGFGDAGYSFIDSDTSTGGDGANRLPGTFGWLNGGASPGDRSSQASLGGGSLPAQHDGRSRKEKMFDQQLDMYKQQRDLGLPQGPRRV